MRDAVKGMLRALDEAIKGKPLMVTVLCPNCGASKRTKMPMLRLFGTQTCRRCKHKWIPPRAKRPETTP